MNATEELLTKVIERLDQLTEAVKGTGLATCGSKESLAILGLTDHKHLAYFHEQGLLPTRRGSKQGGYSYYKTELYDLANKIYRGEIQVPKVSQLKAA